MKLELFLNQYLNLISRILPKVPRSAVIGFDIGSNSIKAVEIGFLVDSVEIKNWAIEPIVAADTKAALKRVLARMSIKNQIPVASVAGKGTLIRYIDMPRMTLEELRKAFVYEIDKYFPFDPQSIYTDCFIIDPQSKEKKVSVLVVAAKKELVDDRMKMFKEEALDLTSMTTNSIATANAFGELVKDPTATATGARAILDIGAAVSNLMILDKNNSPRFTRDIYIGGKDISKQISNLLGVDLAKADELKLTPGDKVNEVTQAFGSSIDNLAEEVRVSFDYFMTEKKFPVTELFLVGGGALYKGVDAMFQKSLNIPVKIWNPLEVLRLGAQVSPTEIGAVSSQLTAAIGLAFTKI